ncbi:NUDIX hydrolase [Shewanella sp. SR44-3]|uniref:NUDIX hydrolase n=1 Tax=unclassified Shewanella TaxID=196818 RepID=UPI0015FE0CF4|nr:NUDIX domain-containing protein [Shewanella sp. SR44-3]MBB1269499.1 NUDIX domain-containing protein [Shewanella sp. SR44-3]
MRHLLTHYHPETQADFVSQHQDKMLIRLATRAIVLRGTQILLLYTQRYHDYSLPGGGINDGESIELGLVRELKEETGAKGVNNIRPFGVYEEYRPWTREGYGLVKMLSYCFSCEIDAELGDTEFEAHEINNGMTPVWVNIDQAIEHNLSTMANSAKKGLSIERETFLLQRIKAELIR